MPCLLACAASPRRMEASTCITLPGAGVKVALDSMRPEVHCPEGDLRGTNWIVSPPEIWRLELDVVYTSTSSLVWMLGLMLILVLLLRERLVTYSCAMFHRSEGLAPADPPKLSCHMVLRPEYAGAPQAEASPGRKERTTAE
jgi:hypothetical protein